MNAQRARDADMTFLELAEKRVSVRGYAPTPVTEEDLNGVLEAGRLAPTAANRQPFHFIVVRDEKTRHALGDPRRKDWFWTAPVVIVVCVEPSQAWSRMDGKNYADVDGAIAMDHMTLCAADLGLGTCWIGAFDPGRVRSVLGLPEGVEPLAMTPLGVPMDLGGPKKRKKLQDIIHYDRWPDTAAP
jgi:nitroreductase